MPMISKNLTPKEEQIIINIGLRVGYFRRKLGITQQMLSDRSGLALNTISKIESKVFFPVGLVSIIRLAAALEVEIWQLLKFD